MAEQNWWSEQTVVMMIGYAIKCAYNKGKYTKYMSKSWACGAFELAASVMTWSFVNVLPFPHWWPLNEKTRNYHRIASTNNKLGPSAFQVYNWRYVRCWRKTSMQRPKRSKTVPLQRNFGPQNYLNHSIYFSAYNSLLGCDMVDKKIHWKTQWVGWCHQTLKLSGLLLILLHPTGYLKQEPQIP